MVRVTQPLKSVIIRNYLNGLSLSQIALETGISKTTAHNVVFDWKSKILAGDIEEIRRFIAEAGRSGITVQQCVQGFRTFQILQEFEIADDFDGWIEDEEGEGKDNNPDSNTSQMENSLLDHVRSADQPIQIAKRSKTNTNKNQYYKTNQISYFINTIYKNCKNHSIKPSIVMKWMEDLFECFIFSENQINVDKIINGQKQKIDLHNEEITQTNELDKEASDEIPLISRISHFIEQKKKELRQLDNSKRSIYQDIVRLDKRKESILADLTKTIEREKRVFSYQQWYNSLKQELHDRYNLTIEEEYGKFAKVINDFKDRDFDASKIINEYKEIESLRQERNLIQTVIDLNSPVRNELLNEIAKLQEQMNYSKHIMNIYNELFKIGFGLKELKQLYSTILEIGLANKIKLDEAVSKFLKDIENQYDNKLGLETTINNLQSEKEKLEDEVPQYQWYLQLQGIVGPTIIHLNSNGITNEDIININQIVIAFKNSNFVDEVSDQQEQGQESGNSSKKTDKKNNRNNNEYWKLFIEKLKSLKNINLEIARQSTILNSLKTQINHLNGKKQGLEKLYLDSVNNLNYIVSQTSYSIDLAKQINHEINHEINKKIMMTPKFFPVFVNLNITKSKDEKKDDDA